MMAWLGRMLRRLRILVRREEVEAEMDEEIRFHLAMEAEELMRTRGLSPGEARRRARIAFGGVERFKEEGRDARGVRPLEDAVRDVSYGLRTLRNHPTFSLVAVLTLGLGIGAVTAIFTLVNAILIQPLPYYDSDRLVAVKHTAPGLGMEEAGLSSGTYFHYRARARSLEGLAVYQEAVVNLSGGEAEAERVELAMSGPELFRILGVRPVLGRLFTEEDANRGFMDVTWAIPVLLSHDLWKRRYGADPGIVGRSIAINDVAREVVGVLPADFDFPRPGTQVWMLSMPPEVTANFAARLGYDAVARMRPGVSPEDAEAELARVLPSIEGAYPDATAQRLAEVRLRPIVVPLKDEVVGDVGAALWILFGGMSFLLLVACANVANLFLLRAEHRGREIAVRRALGAGRRDLARLFFIESALLSIAGAALGALLAGVGVSALVTLAPIQLPRLHEVRVDAWTLGFASGVAVLVSLLFGTVSMLRRSRPAALTPALASGGRSGTESRERQRVRGVFVAAQVALALTLLVGSALMVQSFFRLARVDPGFDRSGVLTVDMGLPFSRAQDHKRIYDALLERVRALPSVTGAAAASELPLTESVWTAPRAYPLRAEGRAVRPGEAERTVALKFFVPGYFQVLRTPVIDGIGFAPGERADAPHPVVVSAALARRLFPGESAVGKRVRRLDSSGDEIWRREPSGERVRQPDYTIAGVVADVREESLRSGAAEIVYVPVLEPRVDPGFIPTEMSLVIRSDGSPLMLAPTVRDIIRDIDPVLGVARIRTLESIVSASTARESFLAVLLVIAGIGSLFLGAVGIYGVVAYTVRRRTREIAIRAALGARTGDVAGMVLRDTLAVVLLGAIVGLAVALPGTRVLRSLLFEVSPYDPVTLVSVTALLVVVAVVASLLPARRAVRIDPMLALRAE